MTVYKGTNREMICTHGAGAFQYVLGQKMTAEESKTASTGLHANEYVLDCMKWYSLPGGRFFRCTAEGSIDEEGERGNEKNGADTKIACTELTLDCELSLYDIAYDAISYMVDHPERDWERTGTMLQVKQDHAEADCAGAIAIARGMKPSVKAEAGAAVGLIREDESGVIVEAACFLATERGTFALRGDKT